MSWNFNPAGWTTGTIPTATDFQHIHADALTWGGNVDAGRYGLVDAGLLTLVPGALPASSFTVTAATWTGGVATLTIGTHTIVTGQHITVASITPTGYNSTDAAITAVTGTTVSYAILSNPGAYSSGGTVVVFGTPGIGTLAVNASGQLLQWSGSAWIAVGTSLPAGSQTGYLQLTPNAGVTPAFQFNSLFYVNPADYNYTSTPTGPSTLTGGAGPQTITLPVAPLGIYGGGTWATVYITAGSGGAAEVLTPSSGTCSSVTQGVQSGTIVVSPVNNHGAGYQVTSATAGFQEAALSQPSKPIIFAGTASWQTGVTLANGSTGHPGIIGSGPNCQIVLQYNSGNGISITTGSFASKLANFQVYPNSGVMASGALIYNSNVGGNLILEDLYIGQSSTRDAYIGVQAASYLTVRGLNIFATYRAFSVSGKLDITGVQITNSRTSGTYISGSAAMYITAQTGGEIRGFRYENGAVQYGLLVDNTSNAVNELIISDFYLDSFVTAGIKILTTSNAVRSWQVTNGRIIDNSGNNNGQCIALSSSAIQWSVSNIQCGYWNAGIVLSGSTYITINSVSIFPHGNSSSGPSGIGDTGIQLDTSAAHIKISDSFIGIGSENSGTIAVFGIVDQNSGSGGSSYVELMGNNIQGSTANISFSNAGPGTAWNVWNNTGVDDVWPTVASAATIDLGSGGRSWYTKAYITGTATVTSILFNSGAPQSGRVVMFSKSDTGTLTIGGGGNIPGTYTLTQHSRLMLTYDSVAGAWN